MLLFASLTRRIDSLHLNLFNLFEKEQSVFWSTWNCLSRIRRFAEDFTNRDEHETFKEYWDRAKIAQENTENAQEFNEKMQSEKKKMLMMSKYNSLFVYQDWSWFSIQDW